MKRFITLLFLLATVAVHAQQKLVTQAKISTKTTIISPEEDENTPPPPPPPPVPGMDGGVRIMFGGDGETKSTTWLKNGMVKTVINSETGRTTTIRDNNKKTTTQLMEMMGKKTGYYATDEEQEQMRKQMDSMMQARRQQSNFTPNTVSATEVVYIDETKKIAGFVCKKAILISTRSNGTKDSNMVWYNPDLKLQGIVSTGGNAGFGTFMSTNNLDGLSKVNGLVMQYESKMGRGRKMIVEITDLEMEKEIKDKEFEIPKDFEMKPMKEMQSGGGFRMIMRQ